jgi:hypothetical protein
MTRDVLGEVARTLLGHVRLEHFIGDDGRPADGCWKRIEEGTLSTGERVLVALALAIVDFGWPTEPPVRISDLMRLDNDNLRAAGATLIALADHR